MGDRKQEGDRRSKSPSRKTSIILRGYGESHEIIRFAESGLPELPGLQAVCRQVDLGHRPVGMVVDERRQRAEGLGFPQRQNQRWAYRP